MKFLFIITMFFVAACSGQNCFKVGGEYSGINGSIEYCYLPNESETEKTPVFDSKEGKGYLVTDAQIVEAVKAIESQKPSISAVPEKLQLKESPIQKFKRFFSKK